MKTRLARVGSVLAICGVVFPFANAAQAATVTFTSSLSFIESVGSLSFASAGLNDTLEVGVAKTIDQFIAVTVSNGAWSASNAPMTASFLFTIPTPIGATTDSGSITGAQVNGSSASGTLAISWPNQPVEFDFSDGTKLQVTLGDLSVACSPAGNNCLAGQDPFHMSGTFLVVNGPASEVPLPGAVLLMGSVLVAGFGFGAVRRRRRQKAA